MRSIVVILFVLLCGQLSAQHIRLEPQFNFLSIDQAGGILVPVGNMNPPYRYDEFPVSQEGTAGGYGATIWYSLNFGTRLYEKMAYGIETGIILNKSTEQQSVISSAPVHSKNLRFPLLAGVRFGSAIDPYHGNLGFGVAGGVELFRTSLSNETGTYLWPKVEFMAGYKIIYFGFSLYPMDIVSYYHIDGATIERVRSSFYEIHFRTAINWFPKKYRADKKPNNVIKH